MGDLIVTCLSPHSRNRRVGEELGQGRTLEEILAGMTMVAEGVKTAVTVHELALRYDVSMPVCNEIRSVIRGDKTAADAYYGLRMPAGRESDPG
jgi:glycerol-3-phosphate dehydrogenase (NAD(P)+)